jgi:hypothetical protein
MHELKRQLFDLAKHTLNKLTTENFSLLLLIVVAVAHFVYPSMGEKNFV